MLLVIVGGGGGQGAFDFSGAPVSEEFQYGTLQKIDNHRLLLYNPASLRIVERPQNNHQRYFASSISESWEPPQH